MQTDPSFRRPQFLPNPAQEFHAALSVALEISALSKTDHKVHGIEFIRKQRRKVQDPLAPRDSRNQQIRTTMLISVLQMSVRPFRWSNASGNPGHKPMRHRDGP